MVNDTVFSGLHSGIATLYAGEEECPPGHTYGPYIRDYYLLHYVLEGKGRYWVHDKEYTLEKDMIFFISPQEITTYSADMEQPWHYIWIGIRGVDAQPLFAAISGKQDILRVQNPQPVRATLAQLATAASDTAEEKLARLALLYRFLALLSPSAPNMAYTPVGQMYTERAIAYIHANLHRRITVEEIAHYLCIERSHFCTVFKRYADMSPQRYIIDLKLQSAVAALETTNLAIGDIARAVGYEDAMLFSRIFRSKYGVSPRAYRNKK